MDGLTALGALGSATPSLNSELFPNPSPAAPATVPATTPAPKAASSAEHPETATFGLPPAQAAAIEAAPSPSPSAQRAGSASLPLSVKYAPSSIPPDVRPAVHFDRTA